MKAKDGWLVTSFIALILSCGGHPYKQGEMLYEYHCAACHGQNGEGLRNLYPPLAGADYLIKHQTDLACIIRNGLEGPILVNGQAYNQPMPGNTDLNDVAIANIINYINQAWGNELDYVQIKAVQEALSRCGADQ